LIATLPAADRLAARNGLGILAAALSFLVSYRFFQDTLYGEIRKIAFRVSPENDLGQPGLIPALEQLKGFISQKGFSLSESLHGGPLLGDLPWLRLAMPELAVLAAAFALYSIRGSRDPQH
jgi:hypothetical protein